MHDQRHAAKPRPRSAPALSEVVDFLAAHAPFDVVDRADLERVAGSAEVEFHRRGTTIFSQGEKPIQHLRVIRSGAVEIVHDERVLDRIEGGELIGHASMLSGLPTGFAARAAEDTLCYRIPAEVAREVLIRPAALPYVARSLLAMPVEAAGTPTPASEATGRPVGALIRGEPVVCRPSTTLREAAEMMTAAGQSSAVVELADGSLGILTDRDLRSRVVAAGLTVDAPVSAAMSAPAYTCPPDRLAADVLLDMLDRGLRHYIVVAADGRLLGVVEDLDLLTIATRSSFRLRRAIARAASPAELREAARELRPMAIALYDARVDATNIASIYTVVLDALTRRAIELAIGARDSPPPSFAWLALGSQARREAIPGSDIDSAIVWFDGDSDEHAGSYLGSLGGDVAAELEACGLPRDAQGVTAGSALVVRSFESWQRAVRSWLEQPRQEQALILISVFLDSRPVWGIHTGTPLADTFRRAPRNEALMRLLARFALSYRPPTGFLRGLVVEHSGEHRGRLDIKTGGLLPIVDLARWAGMSAGVTSASTRERLRAAGEAGTLSAGDAQTLEEAFDLMLGLRIEHQIERLRAGLEPDDHLDPKELGDLTRSYLKEAFRAVATVQKRVASELSLGVR